MNYTDPWLRNTGLEDINRLDAKAQVEVHIQLTSAGNVALTKNLLTYLNLSILDLVFIL